MQHVASLVSMRSPRRHPRVTVNLPVTMASPARSLEATLHDVAAGGACVRTDRPAEIGTPVTIRFRMLRDRVHEATGRVVWQCPDLPGFGVAFEESNEAMQSFMSHLVKLPEVLRSIYLADVRDPRIVVPDQ
jgi:hypothetical protein